MTTRLLPALATCALLGLAACSQLPIKDAPQPQSRYSANVTPLTNATQFQYSEYVQITSPIFSGGSYFLRGTMTEPSGGNKLYVQMGTPTSNPDFSRNATYVSSPGAIDIATCTGSDYSTECVIVGADYNIYYHDAGTWYPISGGGLHFTHIASNSTLYFQRDPNSPSSLSVEGNLFAIADNGHPYLLINSGNGNTSWTQLGSITARSIAVDVNGTPWMVSQKTVLTGRPPSPVEAGTLYKGSFITQPSYSVSWAAVTVPEVPLQVTTTNGTNPGVEILSLDGNRIYFASLNTPPYSFTSILSSAPTNASATSIYGGPDNQFFEFIQKSTGGYYFDFYYTFDGQ